MKCGTCGKDAHRHACDTCIADTRRRLRETELYAHWLTTPDLLSPIRGASGRSSPGYASRPPIRLDAVALTDPRSATQPPQLDEARGIGLPEDEAPIWPILGTLHNLATYVRAQLDHHPAPHVTLSSEIGYLLGHLNQAAHHPWIDDVIADIHDLHTQARTTAHDQPPRPLGTCLVVGCGGDVYPPPPRRSSTKCTGCGRSYTGLDLVRLRTQEQR